MKYNKWTKSGLFLLTLLCSSFFFSQAHAAIVFQSSNNNTCGSCSNNNYSVTIPSLGTNGYAIIYVLGYHYSGNTNTSVSIGGINATQVNDITNGVERWTTWVISNPPTGTQTININYSGSIAAIVSYDTYYSGVGSLDATSTFSGNATNSGTACPQYPGGGSMYQCYDGFINTNLGGDSVVAGGRMQSGTPTSSLSDTLIDNTNLGNNEGSWQRNTLTGSPASYMVEYGEWTSSSNGGEISILALQPFSAPTNPTLFWINPTNGYNRGDFQTWQLGFTNIAQQPDIPYYVRVEYSTIATSSQRSFTDNQGNANKTIFNYAVPGNATGTVFQAKAQQLFIPTFGSTTAWQVDAQLLNNSNQIIADTGNINIYITGNGTLPSSPGQIPGSLQTYPNANGTFSQSSTTGANATSSPFFVDCSGYQFVNNFPFSLPFIGSTTVPFFTSDAIPGYFCYLWKFTANSIGWAIIPPSNATQELANSFTQFENVLPLNIVFGVANTINLPGKFEVGVSTTPVNPNIQMNIPDLNGGTTGSIELVGTSTLKNDFTNPHCDATCAQGHVNDIGTWTSVTIWIGAFASIYKLFF